MLIQKLAQFLTANGSLVLVLSKAGGTDLHLEIHPQDMPGLKPLAFEGDAQALEQLDFDLHADAPQVGSTGEHGGAGLVDLPAPPTPRPLPDGRIPFGKERQDALNQRIAASIVENQRLFLESLQSNRPERGGV